MSINDEIISEISIAFEEKGIEYNQNCSVGGEESHFINKLREAFKKAKRDALLIRESWEEEE